MRRFFPRSRFCCKVTHYSSSTAPRSPFSDRRRQGVRRRKVGTREDVAGRPCADPLCHAERMLFFSPFHGKTKKHKRHGQQIQCLTMPFCDKKECGARTTVFPSGGGSSGVRFVGSSIRPDLIRPGLIHRGLVRPGLIRPGLIRPGLIRPGLIRRESDLQGVVRTTGFPGDYSPSREEIFAGRSASARAFASRMQERRVGAVAAPCALTTTFFVPSMTAPPSVL